MITAQGYAPDTWLPPGYLGSIGTEPPEPSRVECRALDNLRCITYSIMHKYNF